MSDIDRLFTEYGAYHQDGRNQLCHKIGIPLIVLGVDAGICAFAQHGVVIATVLTLAMIAYYARIAGRAGAFAGAALLLPLCGFAITLHLAWPIALAAFAAGWVLQFVGHAFEGKSPAFLTNLVHLLVGPLWVAMLFSKRTA